MSYEKQTWATGDVISATMLNHMEDGIANGSGLFDSMIVGRVEFTPKYNEQAGGWQWVDVTTHDDHDEMVRKTLANTSLKRPSYILVTVNFDGTTPGTTPSNTLMAEAWIDKDYYNGQERHVIIAMNSRSWVSIDETHDWLKHEEVEVTSYYDYDNPDTPAKLQAEFVATTSVLQREQS